MNPWNPSEAAALLSSEFCLRLTQSLLHFLWQGLAIGLASWTFDRLMRRAPSQWRYAVSVAALLAMLACVPATFVLLEKTPGQVQTAAAPALSPPAESNATIGSSASALPVVESVAHVRPVEDVSPTIQPGDWNRPALHILSTRLAPYATGAYLLGVACMLARLGMALWSGHQLRQSALPLADPAILAMVARQARRVGLKIAPAVAWCQRAAVPLVVGIARPIILLPPAIASGLAPDQLEALLAHELAHLRRLDLAVNLVQRLAESVLFFHPAVWYVSRQISIERENCCDDCVLRAGWGRVEYADALVRMAEVCAAVRGLAGVEGAALLAASGSAPSQFKRRVLRLLDAQDHLRVGISRGWLLAAIGAILLGLVAVPFAANWKGGAEAGQEGTVQPEPAKAPASEEASMPEVHASLQFLAARQNEDGSFGSGKFPLDRSPALTAICGLALMQGDVIRDPELAKAPGFIPARYSGHRDKAIKFLLKQQRDDGLLAGSDQLPVTWMYNHALVMWFLAEASRIPGRTPDLKEPLEKAVAFAASAQSEDGVWRYPPQPDDGEAEVTAVQVLALSAARRANVEVPQEVIDKAIAYLKRWGEEQTRGFASQPVPRKTAYFRCAAALAALTSAGAADDDWVKQGRDDLVRDTGDETQFNVDLYLGDGYFALEALRTSRGYADRARRLHEQFRAGVLRERQADGSWRQLWVSPERTTAWVCLVLLAAPPAKEDRAAADEPSPGERVKLAFDEAPWPEVLTWYAAAMKQPIDMKVVPPGTFTYKSSRPMNQGEMILLINRELVRRGFCLNERNGSLTVETADVIARQYAESLRKEFMYGHELRKGPDSFDAYFEIVECRAVGETRPPAPEGPAIAYVLKARRDYTAAQLTGFLEACFGTVSLPSLKTGQPILADGFATLHAGKWHGASAPALAIGEQFEVWQNRFQEWNARPPADYRVVIDGVVVGTDAKPLPSATIRQLMLEEGSEFPGLAFGGEAVVDDQGKFQVSLQHATQYVRSVYFFAVAPGYSPQRIGPIAVGFDKPGMKLKIELKPGFAGRLRLVDRVGSALTRGEVEVAAQDDLWAPGIPMSKLPITGEPMVVENCPAGPLLLKVRVPGCDEQEVRDVRLAAGEVTEVKVPVSPKEQLYFRGQEAVDRIKKVNPAWSDAQEGVRFGIAIIREKRQFHADQRVPLEMFVRNVGREAVSISLAADFAGNVPELKSATGVTIQVERIPLSGTVPLYRESLKPGEAFGFRHFGVGLGPRTWPPYWDEPKQGKYTLRHTHEIDVAPADEGKPGQRLKFTSGVVEFEVVDGAASDRRPPADDATLTLQAALLDRQEYVEGTFPNEERQIKSELLRAEQAVNQARSTLEFSKRLAAKEMITPLELHRVELALKLAQAELDVFQGRLDVLLKFTKKKTVAELDRKVVRAIEALLSQRVALKVTHRPLIFVLDDLEKVYGIPMTIDLQEVRARGATMHAQVSIDIADKPLREVFKAVLASAGLDFDASAEGIHVPAKGKLAGGAPPEEEPAKVRLEDTEKKGDGAAKPAPRWGNLALQFAYDGPRPEPKKIKIDRDASTLGPETTDQSLLVGNQGGLANVLAFATSADLPIHPEERKRAEQPVEMKIVGSQLLPRVVPLMVHQKLKLINDTPVAFNIRSDGQRNSGFNVLVAARDSYLAEFPVAEKSPAQITDNIHAWMQAFVMPLEHPYAAASGTDGMARLSNLPEGEWTFHFWHEKGGFLKSAESGQRDFKISIAPGENRLALRVSPEFVVKSK